MNLPAASVQPASHHIFSTTVFMLISNEPKPKRAQIAQAAGRAEWAKPASAAGKKTRPGCAPP
jgi:hypothetical protein